MEEKKSFVSKINWKSNHMSSGPDKQKSHEKRHDSWCDTRMTLNVTCCSCVILQDHLGRSCRLVFFTSCFLPRASASEQQLPPCSEYLGFLFKEEHGGRDLMKCLPGQRPRGKVTHNTSFLPYQRGMNGQIQFRDSPRVMMLSDIETVFPVLDVAADPKLVRWHFKQIPHSFMDGCTLWLPRGALGGLGRTVIFRPINSGVQVCGIIHHPKGLATSSAITACLQP